MNFLGIGVVVERDGSAILRRKVQYSDYWSPIGCHDFNFWRVELPWDYARILAGVNHFWHEPIPAYAVNEHTLLQRRNKSNRCINGDNDDMNLAGRFAGFYFIISDDGSFNATLHPLVRITVKEAILEGKRSPESRTFRKSFKGPEDMALCIHNWLHYVTGKKTWEELA